MCRQAFCPECVLGVDSLGEVPADPLAPPPANPDHHECPGCSNPYPADAFERVPCACRSWLCRECLRQAHRDRSGALVRPYSHLPGHLHWHQILMNPLQRHPAQLRAHPLPGHLEGLLPLPEFSRRMQRVHQGLWRLSAGQWHWLANPADYELEDLLRIETLAGASFPYILPSLRQFVAHGATLVSHGGAVRPLFRVIDESVEGNNCLLRAVLRQLEAHRRRAADGLPPANHLDGELPSPAAVRRRLVDDLRRRSGAGEFADLQPRGIGTDAYIEGIRLGRGLSEMEVQSVANVVGATIVLCQLHERASLETAGPLPVAIRLFVDPEQPFRVAGSSAIHVLYMPGHFASMLPADRPHDDWMEADDAGGLGGARAPGGPASPIVIHDDPPGDPAAPPPPAPPPPAMTGTGRPTRTARKSQWTSMTWRRSRRLWRRTWHWRRASTIRGQEPSDAKTAAANGNGNTAALDAAGSAREPTWRSFLHRRAAGANPYHPGRHASPPRLALNRLWMSSSLLREPHQAGSRSWPT
ncbi:unnamed protein product [Vitrella brassicaformis CCMP3155]|uniref:Uncharacterized protein n=1 Tax=Vitrella brassicaformis (strain CCMP3155) TaxID=1169540 RepID=A0A0G4GL56_VITBC|nr:unnamed protein product [Vitrella brassicaformis CCMP3155]|eukprot:CEM30772.1 unnamed protein product [Vitrella brassicaformis CCMP3155]